MSDSMRPYGLQPTRFLCPQDSPGKNTGVDCYSLLQRIFPTQRSNGHLLCLTCIDRQVLYHQHHLGSHFLLFFNIYKSSSLFNFALLFFPFLSMFVSLFCFYCFIPKLAPCFDFVFQSVLQLVQFLTDTIFAFLCSLGQSLLLSFFFFWTVLVLFMCVNMCVHSIIFVIICLILYFSCVRGLYLVYSFSVY